MLVTVLALAGFLLVRSFADDQQQREITQWQNKLNLIADSRSADISTWLTRHFSELDAAVSNPALQLYLTSLMNAKEPTAVNGMGQEVFHNVLAMTGDRLGFFTKPGNELAAVAANVHAPPGTGLAIVAGDGRIVISTQGLPVLDSELAAKVSAAPRGQASLIDMFTAADGSKRIGFVIPIYPIQGDRTADQQIGKLVGVKTLGDDFYKLLVQPGSSEKTLEAMLVRKEGDNVSYLTPAKSDAVLATQFALSTPDLDASYAITSPGNFAIKRDRQSHPVLMTSRAIANSPWTLLLHIDRDQALAHSDSWRVKMQCIMFLAILTILTSMIAVWWYATSKRALLLSAQTARLAAHSIAQERLLRVVTDNQPEPIFIADSKNIVRFANAKATALFNTPMDNVVGKELGALLGAARAKGYIEANAIAAVQKPAVRTPHREADGRIVRSEHIALGPIPIDGLPHATAGVLVVEQDVTDIVTERERRVRTLRHLIDTLVRLVDARDPNAANHSASVALVAREVAQEMGLSHMLVETAETAGNLMNIGKIAVPSAILTKKAALAKDEMQAIQESMQQSAALLSGIEFDGPVVETLEQAAEYYDGSGWLKLSGEQILVTARIIAVANSFIGMISARSYRGAISIERATTLLLEKIDTQFDRRVVVALINFIENKQGRQMLAELSAKKVIVSLS
jgi:HD-GYP domain-containing protein (c-di-GMP phosphodiesterase class II)